MRPVCAAHAALLLSGSLAWARDAPRPTGDGLAPAAALLARFADPSDLDTDRAVYWCLADLYAAVAGDTRDPQIAARARAAARRYEPAGPGPAEVVARGWPSGSRVAVPLDGVHTCAATVR